MEEWRNNEGKGASPCLPLPVIPVIDVMAGSVVRAVGGRRNEYAPIQTPLTTACDPISVAGALAARVGHRHLYVADLDALQGREPDWDAHRRLLAEGFALWLDVGLAEVGTALRVRRIAEQGTPVDAVIAALESLPSVGVLRDLVQAVGPERLVFSLDLRRGEVVTKRAALRLSPLVLMEHVLAAGIRRIVVIDVAAVGRGEGPPVAELCRQIRTRALQIELVAGGGVRGVGDLARLRHCGCDAALVSSWLHAGPAASQG